MRTPHPIPYQGSKRRLSGAIVSCLPKRVARLVEPFAGSAAIALAAAAGGKARRFWLNDINEALMALWRSIIESPDELAGQYRRLWEQQTGRERSFYLEVRRGFNQTGRPDYFLYLLARCVKASVRYNAAGQFNQSPDNRRRGARPDTMAREIKAASVLLGRSCQLTCLDYRDVLAETAPSDVVYLDPPYQGVCGKRDPRYAQSVAFDQIVESLSGLCERDIPFIVSYDGRTGDKEHGRLLPSQLNLVRVELEAGPSTQATLLGRRRVTFESLYLSPALLAMMKKERRRLPGHTKTLSLLDA